MQQADRLTYAEDAPHMHGENTFALSAPTDLANIHEAST